MTNSARIRDHRRWAGVLLRMSAPSVVWKGGDVVGW